MTNHKGVLAEPARPLEFQVVCVNCDTLGIVFDCPEGAPSWTEIMCRQCGARRGTLGGLRNLSTADGQDLFEV